MTTFLGSVQRFSDFIVSMFGDGGAVGAIMLFLVLCVSAVWGIVLVVDALMWRAARRRAERTDRVIAAATGRRRPPRAPGLTSSRKRCG